jgi:hypothetical protein
VDYLLGGEGLYRLREESRLLRDDLGGLFLMIDGYKDEDPRIPIFS